MRALVLVLVMAIVQSGCSVLFVDGPHVVDAKVVCTDEMTYPLIDAAAAAVGIATPFILEAMRDRSTMDPNFLLYVPLWGAGVAAAISAVIGISKVKRCRTTSHAAM